MQLRYTVAQSIGDTRKTSYPDSRAQHVIDLKPEKGHTAYARHYAVQLTKHVQKPRKENDDAPVPGEEALGPVQTLLGEEGEAAEPEDEGRPPYRPRP
jgi:hypothetical protein